MITNPMKLSKFGQELVNRVAPRKAEIARFETTEKGKIVTPPITVVTHPGAFHADDVLCVAMLYYVLGFNNVKVVRSSDPMELSGADMVIDIPCTSELKWVFDHHSGPLEYFVNRVPKASCGKLFEALFDHSDPKYNLVLNNLIYGVCAADNGYTATNHKNPLTEIVRSLNPSAALIRETFDQKYGTDECKRTDEVTTYAYDSWFYNAVKVATDVFVSVLYEAKSIVDFEENLDLNNVFCGFLKIDIPTMPYRGTVRKNNLMGVLVRDSTRNVWKIKPVKTDFFPEEWRGKDGDDLAKVTGEPCAVYCHWNGSVMTVRDSETARRIINKLVLLGRGD